ncbi:hypothetical protein K438DRAFT_1786334 [Mycena galopus ATCC 62051]|nr:hypothetical protein K438DRAFT_1786334 [Mycena galopus ATCC 62051]
MVFPWLCPSAIPSSEIACLEFQLIHAPYVPSKGSPGVEVEVSPKNTRGVTIKLETYELQGNIHASKGRQTKELPGAYCVEVLRHFLGVITAKYGQISDFKTFGKVKTAERDVSTRQLLSNGTKEALKESSWCTYEMQRLGKVSSKVWIWQPLPLPVLYPLRYLQRYTLTPGKPYIRSRDTGGEDGEKQRST